MARYNKFKNHKRKINKKRFQNKKNIKYYKIDYKNPRPQKLYPTNRWRNPTPEEIEVKKTMINGYYETFCITWNKFISKMFNIYRNKTQSYYFWMNKFYSFKLIQYRAFLNSKIINNTGGEVEINNYIGAVMATLYRLKDRCSSGKDENSIPNYLTIEELDLRIQKHIFNFVKKYWDRYVYRKVLI